MAELCHFYGWTFDTVRSMTMVDIDAARNYMMDERKHGSQEGGQRGARGYGRNRR